MENQQKEKKDTAIEQKREWIIEQIRKAPAADILFFERICIQFAS